MNNNQTNHGISQAQLDAHWMAFTGNRDFKKDNAKGDFEKFIQCICTVKNSEGNYEFDKRRFKAIRTWMHIVDNYHSITHDSIRTY